MYSTEPEHARGWWEVGDCRVQVTSVESFKQTLLLCRYFGRSGNNNPLRTMSRASNRNNGHNYAKCAPS